MRTVERAFTSRSEIFVLESVLNALRTVQAIVTPERTRPSVSTTKLAHLLSCASVATSFRMHLPATTPRSSSWSTSRGSYARGTSPSMEYRGWCCTAWSRAESSSAWHAACTDAPPTRLRAAARSGWWRSPRQRLSCASTWVHPAVWIAVRQRRHPPRLKWPPLHVVYVAPARTVADCFKWRSLVGLAVAIEALRAYLDQHRQGRAELRRMAEVCRVTRVIRPYLEAMP